MKTTNQPSSSSMSTVTVVEFQRPTLPSEMYLSEFGDDGLPYKIHGVALGAGDVTKGKSGIKKKWPADELEEAAETLQGTNLVVDHSKKSEDVIGKVVKAGYREDTGVVYEAELYDETYAEKIENGMLEVSVRGKHADVSTLSEDDETGAIVVEDIEFKDLSIVSSGAAPSNTVEIGEHEQLSEAQLSQFTESLASDFEPSDWVQWDGGQGIIISPVEGEEVEVDVYEEMNGEWRSTGETEMVSIDSLDSWDVDEEDIGAREDEESAESAENESEETDDESPSPDEESYSDNAETPSDHSDGADPMQFSEGQLVEWQVNSDMFGEIVHIDQRHGKIMVEVMRETDDGMQTTNHTVSAGFSDLVPRDAEMASTTKDVPVEDAEPSHEPMGTSLVEDFISENGADATVTEFLDWLEQENLANSSRGESEEKPYRSQADVKESRADSERYIEDDADELAERFDDYPEAASENAQMALDAKEETDNPNDCGTETGWKRANQLANNESISREQLGKMASFARHEGNSEMSDDEGKADCGWMMWKAWGGDEGVEWAQKKLDSIEEENSSTSEGENESESSDVEPETSAELLEYEFHEATWDGTTESDWSSPDMEDFDTDDLSEIADHFLISETGFPPENFTDLKLPIVEPDGDLNLNALAAVKGGRGVSAVEGLSDDMESEIVEYVNGLANDPDLFDRNWGDEEENKENLASMKFNKGDWVAWDWSGSTAYGKVEETFSGEGTVTRTINGTEVSKDSDEQPVYLVKVWQGDEFGGRALRQEGARNFRSWDDHPNEDEMSENSQSDGSGTAVRVLPGDDLRTESLGESKEGSRPIENKVTTMDEEIEQRIEEVDEPVVVESDELGDLREKATQFEELSDDIEAIRQRTEILDAVSRDDVEELRESDEPVVVESADWEELQQEAEQVKSVYAASLAEEMEAFDADEIAERFDIAELREKHEEVVGGIEELASSEDAEPQSVDPSEEELQEETGEESQEAELAEKASQKQEEIIGKIKEGRL